MSEDISVNFTRGGTPIAANVAVQLDKMEAAETVYYAGADPHFSYNGYTTALPINDPLLIRQGDLLIDRVTTDPNTQKPRQWRIISDPEVFPDALGRALKGAP